MASQWFHNGHNGLTLYSVTSRLAAPWGMNQGSGGSGGSGGSPYADGSTAGTVLALLKNKMTGEVDAEDLQRTALN
jgi:hypothetical protein